MAASPLKIFQVPFLDRVIDERRFLSTPWERFFRFLQELILPLGSESYFPLNNNQVEAADIVGMALDYTKVSQGIVEYLVQRVTVGTNPVQLLESGVFHLVYLPTENSWSLIPMGTPGPHDADITFTVTSSGQVQYTTGQVDGSPSISKIVYRIRTLAGKNKQYSTVG